MPSASSSRASARLPVHRGTGQTARIYIIQAERGGGYAAYAASATTWIFVSAYGLCWPCWPWVCGLESESCESQSESQTHLRASSLKLCNRINPYLGDILPYTVVPLITCLVSPLLRPVFTRGHFLQFRHPLGLNRIAISYTTSATINGQPSNI
jgi:hypothetical protein